MNPDLGVGPTLDGVRPFRSPDQAYIKILAIRATETKSQLFFHGSIMSSILLATFAMSRGAPASGPRLKQRLHVKTFVGTSANALHIQIWTALIALLILKYLQLKATFAWSVSNLVALLRMNLFVYRDLWTWLNDPFTGPPPVPEPTQVALPLH